MELPVVPLAGRARTLQTRRAKEMKWALKDMVMGGYRADIKADSYKLILFDSRETAEAYLIGHVMNEPRLADFKAVPEMELPFNFKRAWKTSP